MHSNMRNMMKYKDRETPLCDLTTLKPKIVIERWEF